MPQCDSCFGQKGKPDAHRLGSGMVGLHGMALVRTRLTSKIPWLITLCMLGLLYAIVPGRSQGLRAYPWFKIPMIATAWALATTPVWESSSVWLMASRWLLIAGLTLPFDVRDIKTIPLEFSLSPWHSVNPALKVSCGIAASFLCDARAICGAEFQGPIHLPCHSRIDCCGIDLPNQGSTDVDRRVRTDS